MEEALFRARVLAEALPYIQRFADKLMVVKLGGAAMLDPELERAFAEDVVLLKAVGMHPLVVHGGGPQIGELLEKLGVECDFVEGMRVTDDRVLDVVEMVLGGTVNGRIVTRIASAGGQAMGLSGRDGAMIKAEPYRLPVDDQSRAPEIIDLGHVGRVKQVDSEFLMGLCNRKMIPVIAPIGVDDKGQAYNINADLVASAVAASIKAEKLILMTDVPGVNGREGELMPTISRAEANHLIKEGVIEQGMIPKTRCALEALEAGVKKAHIIDGRVSHALLLEIFTDKGVGTEIKA